MTDCTKIKYPNRPAAIQAMKAIVAATTTERQKIPRSIYPCSRCMAWHLTSQEPKGKRARRWNAALRS